MKKPFAPEHAERRHDIRARLAQIAAEHHPLECQAIRLSPLIRDRKSRIEELPEYHPQVPVFKSEVEQFSEQLEAAHAKLGPLETEREELQAELRKTLSSDKTLRATVERQLQTLKDLRSQVVSLAGMKESTGAAIAEKAASFDLGNKDDFAEFSRLLMLEKMIPLKIDAAERAEILQRAVLVQSIDDYISGQISQLAGALQRRAHEKTRGELRHHFSDDADLARAVAGSVSVRESSEFILTITNPRPEDLVPYVEGLLQTADRVIAAAERID